MFAQFFYCVVIFSGCNHLNFSGCNHLTFNCCNHLIEIIGRNYSPDQKNQSRQTYSCPRLASLGIVGAQLRAPLNPLGPSCLGGLRKSHNWSSIMPRGAILFDSGCNFFQSRLFILMRQKIFPENDVLQVPITSLVN